jgi:hypothetical protein
MGMRMMLTSRFTAQYGGLLISCFVYRTNRVVGFLGIHSQNLSDALQEPYTLVLTLTTQPSGGYTHTPIYVGLPAGATAETVARLATHTLQTNPELQVYLRQAYPG